MSGASGQKGNGPFTVFFRGSPIDPLRFFQPADDLGIHSRYRRLPHNIGATAHHRQTSGRRQHINVVSPCGNVSLFYFPLRLIKHRKYLKYHHKQSDKTLDIF
ncbi:hypothetical protein [Acerihabitans sp.]|uniref:hypothetical protein n=1 Tax=Acerihabitans sp. TaxID=2811394 RepID=UPI002EDB014A